MPETRTYMEKLLFKKTLSDIQTADGFSDSCGFWFLCWHHYSRWEKGLQALQEFISENEKPNMTDHPVFLTADVWIPGKADIIEQIALTVFYGERRHMPLFWKAIPSLRRRRRERSISLLPCRFPMRKERQRSCRCMKISRLFRPQAGISPCPAPMETLRI